MPKKLFIESTVRQVRMLTDKVKSQLQAFHFRWSADQSRCIFTEKDQGPMGLEHPIISHAPFQRIRLFTGTRERGSYNIHVQLAKFRGLYYCAFSNGRRDELTAGQRIMLCNSPDGQHWSEAIVIVEKPDTSYSHTCVGLSTDEEKLHVIVRREDTQADESLPGMRRIDTDTQELIVYSSSNAIDWKKTFVFPDTLRSIFEAPRSNSNGALLCVGALKNGSPVMLRWPDGRLCEPPELIPIQTEPEASFPYGEGSWYETSDGTIIVFWRDEGMSCRLWVNWSEDGGQTFSSPACSDIPDSMSRIYAGRLEDGQYYLCGNAFPTLLNRMHLLLLVSRDGLRFDRVRIVVDDPTSQRLFGLLKEDGYQYPCCLPAEEKLLIGYSVNKEDIECGWLDPKALSEDIYAGQ